MRNWRHRIHSLLMHCVLKVPMMNPGSCLFEPGVFIFFRDIFKYSFDFRPFSDIGVTKV